MQLIFRNKYNARAIRYICGDEVRKCTDAFHNWVGALPRNLDQLVADKSFNMYHGLFVGFNADASKMTTDTMLH